MDTNERFKNLHLLGRAGFGLCAAEFSQLESFDCKTLFKKLLQQSNANFRPLKVTDIQTLEELNRQTKLTSNRKPLNQFHQKNIKRLTALWLDEMANSKAQLREKLALFWHGHFACRINNSYHQELLLSSIRKNALGNFGDLLREVSKSAAMLAFLNNQQNKKQHPNENFAREVMELFTMGIGHYEENDVKEAARAFTGWSYNAKSHFLFRPKVHDDGQKNILGAKGNFTGDDVIDLLLEQRATATYITEKIYRNFVNTNVSHEHVQWLAQRFYDNHYQIEGLLTDIFTSDWFYDSKNVGVHIKSPVELTTGIRRVLSLRIQNEDAQILLQRLLGQWLFYPPNVAGWPGGKAWIDSSSLLLRLKLPQLIKNNEHITYNAKSNDDVDMGLKKTRKNNRYQIMADIDWSTWAKHFASITESQLLPALSASLLSQKAPIVGRDLIGKFSKSAVSPLQTYTLAIMSLPEYQLC